MKRSCITIDRQYGSGGREVGRLLSKRLEIPLYDGELLLMAAERFGINPGLLEERDERRSGSLLHDIAIFANSMQNFGQMFEPYQIFEAVSDTIKRLAMEGPAIFMGRCADVVLKEVCSSLNLFIYASSMEERIKRIHSSDHIPMKNIESLIKKKDQQRSGYYKMFAEKEWGKMENYDLCLNTTAFGYEGCADIIAGMAERSAAGGKKV